MQEELSSTFIDTENEYGYFYGRSLLNKAQLKLPLIEHIVYERDVMCISSAPGIGKTMLALQLICNMTTATPFLGIYRIPRPLNVLYIQTEGDRAETIERLELMAQHMKIDHRRWGHINLPGLAINDAKEFEYLNAMLDSYAMLYDFIWLDPLYTTVKGSMRNDDIATQWIRNLRVLKSRYGCGVGILNHDSKPQYQEGSLVDLGNNNSYGSVFWQAFFNHNFKLKKTGDVFTLEGGKQRSNKIIDKIAMKLVGEPLGYVAVTEDTNENFLRVLNLLSCNKALTPKQMMELTNISRSTIYRILDKLVEQGKIEEVPSLGVSKFKKKELDIKQ